MEFKELLETQQEFNDTDEAILIKRYVIKRVAQIVKKNSLNSNKISFLWLDKAEGEQRGLYPELGYKVPEPKDYENDADYKKAAKKWREKTKPMINRVVKGTLETLKKASAITRYEEYREDGTKNPTSPVVGYKIYFDKKTTNLPG